MNHLPAPQARSSTHTPAVAKSRNGCGRKSGGNPQWLIAREYQPTHSSKSDATRDRTACGGSGTALSRGARTPLPTRGLVLVQLLSGVGSPPGLHPPYRRWMGRVEFGHHGDLRSRESGQTRTRAVAGHQGVRISGCWDHWTVRRIQCLPYPTLALCLARTSETPQARWQTTTTKGDCQ